MKSKTSTVCVAVIAGTYGEDRVRVRQLGKSHRRFPGRWITQGAGYAGSIAYASQERAMGTVEFRDVRFLRWEQPRPYE